MPPIFLEHPDAQRATMDRLSQVRGQMIMARSQVATNPRLVMDVANLAAAYGASGIPPGVLTSAAMMGIQPGDPRIQQLATETAASLHEPSGLGAVFSKMGDGLRWVGSGAAKIWDISGADSVVEGSRPAIRGAFAAFDFAWNEVIGRPFRTAVASGAGGRGSNVGGGFGAALSIGMSGPGVPATVGADPGSVYENYSQSGEAPLTSAWREWRETGNANVGSGFFIGEQAFERSLASNQLRHEGDLISPGRFYAGQLLEPGSQPFHLASGTIDFAAQVALDPAAIGLGAAANIADARRAFNLPRSVQSMDDVRAYMGAVDGHRGGVDVGTYVNRFLNSERSGRALVDRMVNNVDAEDIWESLGRHQNRRVIREVRDATTPDQVKQTLGAHLGVDTRNRPRSGPRQAMREANLPIVRRSIQDMRLLDEIPGHYLNAENLDESLETWDQWLKNANLPTETRKEMFSRYIDLEDGDQRGLYELVSEAAAHVDDVIQRDMSTFDNLPNFVWDSRQRMATRVLDMFTEEVDHYRQFKADDIMPALQPQTTLTINGRRVLVPQPTDLELEQMMTRGLPLPDFRQIRRATSSLAPILDSGLGRPTIGLFESFMGIWKPIQLLRIAWTTRVLGEEVGARLGAAGLDSPFHHFGDWLGFVLAEKNGRLAGWLKKLDDPKGFEDVLGEVLSQSDQFRAAMSSDAAAWAGEFGKRVKRGDLVEYTRAGKRGRGLQTDEGEFLDHASMRFRDMWQDPIARRVAKGSDFEYRVGIDFDEAGEVWYHGTPNLHDFRVSTNPPVRNHAGTGTIPDSYMGAHFSSSEDFSRSFSTRRMEDITREEIDEMFSDMTVDQLDDLLLNDVMSQSWASDLNAARLQMGDEAAMEYMLGRIHERLIFDLPSGVEARIAQNLRSNPTGRLFRANVKVDNPYTGAARWDELTQQSLEYLGDNIDPNELRQLLAEGAAAGDEARSGYLLRNFDANVENLISQGATEPEAMEMAARGLMRNYLTDDIEAPTTELARRAGEMYRDHLIAQGHDGVKMAVGDGDVNHLIVFDDASIIQESFGGQRILTGPDAVREWFWSDAQQGAKLRQQLGEASGPNSTKRTLVDDEVARSIKVNGQTVYNNAREASDAYIDSVIAQVEMMTGNNPELLAAISEGKLGGLTLKHLGEFTTRFGQQGIPRAERNALRAALAPHIDSLPDTVLGIDSNLAKRGERWDRFVETMFDFLMSTPSDTLSRSPAFRQFYFQRMDELAPRLSGEFSDDLVESFTKNNVKFQNAGNVGKGDVVFADLKSLDAIAKQFALEETRKLLYSLDRRGQWADILRNIVPFGEAWKEVLGTWSRLLVQRPKNVRRFQQIVQGARGQDDDPNSGFFHTDPQSGQEMFSYPLVGRAMSGLLNQPFDTGANFGAQGRVQGLNLVAGSFLPGVGPLGAVAASALIPDAPDFDWVRNALLPFGEERFSGGLGSWLEAAAAPAWLEKVLAGTFSRDADRRYANMRMALYESMMNQGLYEPHEIDQALEATKEPARVMLVLQGIAQFALPTGPDLDHELMGHEALREPGNTRAQRWYSAQVLGLEFRAMAEELGSFDAAVGPFFERFGIDPLLISQPSSRTIKERSFETAGWRWERTMQDKKDVADYTLGYFAPLDTDTESFEIDAWLDAVSEGASIPLTADQQAHLYNNAVGQMQYRNVKNQIDAHPTLTQDQKNLLLRQYRAGLRASLPGFDTISPSLPSRPDLPILIDELRNAAGDEELGATPAGQAIAAYMQARDQVLARADGVSLEGTRDFALRMVLNQYGSQLAQSVPEFRKVWVEVLVREVQDAAELAQNAQNAQNAQTPSQVGN